MCVCESKCNMTLDQFFVLAAMCYIDWPSLYIYICVKVPIWHLIKSKNKKYHHSDWIWVPFILFYLFFFVCMWNGANGEKNLTQAFLIAYFILKHHYYALTSTNRKVSNLIRQGLSVSFRTLELVFCCCLLVLVSF